MKPNKIFILTTMVVLLSGCLSEKNESYTTMDNYIRYVEEFMKFFTKGKRSEKFYEK